MKKRIAVIIIIVMLFVCLFSITGCFVNRKTNSIISGVFSGTTENDNNIVYYLEVEEIDKNTYENEWPINVTKDLSTKNKYYRFNFYWCDKEKNINKYVFENLKDKITNTKAIPIEYIDMNNNSIIPSSTKYSKTYTVIFNEQYILLEEAK